MITDLAAVKTALKIPSTVTTQDDFLAQLLVQADRAVKSWLDRELEQNTYTEFLAGTNTPFLRLRYTPVTQVVGVWSDPTAAWNQEQGGAFQQPGAQLIPGQDYALVPDAQDGVTSNAGLLQRINTVWAGSWERNLGLLYANVVPGRGNHKVVYVAGYTPQTMPLDLQMAVCLIVAKLNRILPRGFLAASESYEERSISLALYGDKNYLFSPEITGLLWPYRRLTA